jgi:hypothetical protein
MPPSKGNQYSIPVRTQPCQPLATQLRHPTRVQCRAARATTTANSVTPGPTTVVRWTRDRGQRTERLTRSTTPKEACRRRESRRPIHQASGQPCHSGGDRMIIAAQSSEHEPLHESAAGNLPPPRLALAAGRRAAHVIRPPPSHQSFLPQAHFDPPLRSIITLQQHLSLELDTASRRFPSPLRLPFDRSQVLSPSIDWFSNPSRSTPGVGNFLEPAQVRHNLGMG